MVLALAPKSHALVALSQFSFTVESINGVDNDIADSLSRLCRNNMIDSPREYSQESYLLSLIYLSVVTQLNSIFKDWYAAQHNS